MGKGNNFCYKYRLLGYNISFLPPFEYFQKGFLNFSNINSKKVLKKIGMGREIILVTNLGSKASDEIVFFLPFEFFQG